MPALPKPDKELIEDVKGILKNDAPDSGDEPETAHDAVNHPPHYCDHPSGIECIEVTRYMDFPIGSAVKYLWRAGLKGSTGRSQVEKTIEDLEKAIWYINDKIKTLKNGKSKQ